jgi:hypothetical protein
MLRRFVFGPGGDEALPEIRNVRVAPFAVRGQIRRGLLYILPAAVIHYSLAARARWTCLFQSPPWQRFINPRCSFLSPENSYRNVAFCPWDGLATFR